MFTISYDDTLIVKIMSFMWYVNIQVTSSFKSHSHMDIQVRNNVILDMYIYACS